MIRDAWFSVGLSGEFPTGELRHQTIAGTGVVMWRTTDGEVVALDGRCSHKRFPLWEGRLLDGDVLECPYHGFAYDTGGTCVGIPALRERSDRIPSTSRQRSFPVVEQDGLIWVWPGDAAQSGDVRPPRTPELGTADWEFRDTGDMEVDANHRLLLENLFDLTHFYPLHESTIGTYNDASVPMDVERDSVDGNPVLRTIRRRTDFSFGPMFVDRFGVERGDRIQMHELIGPGLVKLTSAVAPTGRLGTDEEQGYVLYQTVTPRTDRTHTWRRYTACRTGSRWARDPDAKTLVDAIVEGAPEVIREDLWAVQEQQKLIEQYGDEGYREVHIRTDAAVVMLRRILDAMEVDVEDLSPAERVRVAVRSQQTRSASSGADAERAEAST